MGDPSYLRYISSPETPIDWSKVPTASQEYLRSNFGIESPPTTLGELMKKFDECKFMGYLRPKLCQALMDVCEFATVDPKVQAGQKHGIAWPRVYMKYLDKINVMIFVLGSNEVWTAESHTVGWTEYYEEPDAEDKAAFSTEELQENLKEKEACDVQLAKEMAVIHKYDPQFDDSFGIRYTALLTKSLWGWKEAADLEQVIQSGQMMEAMMTLPLNHPALKQYLASSLAGRGF